MIAKSIFQSKTFQCAAITLIGGLATTGIGCAYDRRYPTKEEAVASIGLCITFGLTVAGRVNISPVYTPKYLPGPDEEQAKTPVD